MSTNTRRRFASTELTTVAVDMATNSAASGTSTRLQISTCTVANKTASAATVTVTITPSGGSPRYIVYQVTIAPNSEKVLSSVVTQILEPGDKISALAGTNSALDFTLAGYEITS
jgi:hypothetical protein